MFIGYMRPSQNDENCEGQHSRLIAYNCKRTYQELHSEKTNRIALENMLSELHQGEKIIVTKLFSIADSPQQLYRILKQIENKNAFFLSIEEGIDTSNLTGYNLSQILQSIIHLQSEMMGERTRKGLLEAKKKGQVIGRPKKPDQNVQLAIKMLESKNYSLAEIEIETGISKSTLYRYKEA